MRKVRTTVLMLALALAGCTTGGDGQLSQPSFTEVASDSPSEDAPDQDVTPAAGSPRAFVFESGVLEFGDFDPYALGDDLFNPCTEITEAEYAEAGFERLPFEDLDGGVSISGFDFCAVRGSTDHIALSFSNGSQNRTALEEQGLVIDGFESSKVPEIYVFGPHHGGEGDCYTQIDTDRGGFGAAASGSPNRTSSEELCSIAVEMIEQLFEVHGVG